MKIVNCRWEFSATACLLTAKTSFHASLYHPASTQLSIYWLREINILHYKHPSNASWSFPKSTALIIRYSACSRLPYGTPLWDLRPWQGTTPQRIRCLLPSSAIPPQPSWTHTRMFEFQKSSHIVYILKLLVCSIMMSQTRQESRTVTVKEGHVSRAHDLWQESQQAKWSADIATFVG